MWSSLKSISSESPLILGGTIDEHLSNHTETYPAEVAETRFNLYDDNLMTGDENLNK